MTILDKIVAHKAEEVARAKAAVPLALLADMPHFNRPCASLKDHILSPEKSGIIAEFKRASPSKGVINDQVSVEEVVKGYTAAGASAISVLTDSDFFQGSLADLAAARTATTLPILRKDFVIDAYQIAEAKAWGADIILLIAASLTPAQIEELSAYAKTLGLNVLLEIHTLEELTPNTWPSIDAIGVNNRNLHTFEVDLEHSIRLAEEIPNSYLKVSESGLDHPDTVIRMADAGFQGFLMGEHFMKQAEPGRGMQEFVNQINR